MVPLLYAEINLFCVGICLIILRHIMADVDKQRKQVLFSHVLIANMLVFILDIFWFIADIQYFDISPLGNYLINAFYYIQAVIASCAWVYYSEYQQESKLSASKWLFRLSLIPIILIIVLVIISYKTHCLFFINEAGRYERGWLYPLQIFLTYGTVALTASKALYKSYQKKYYARKYELRAIASFAVYPLIFGIVQILIPSVPLFAIGITLSTVNVHLSLQEQKISLDSLTRLNNRNQLNIFMTNKLRQLDRYKTLYLLIIDVDYFKKINDTYGHLEGDLALIHVADALRQACRRTSHFIARYGGDEFIIIAELDSSQSIDQLCSVLHQTIKEINERYDTPYELAISIGYAKYEKHMEELNDLIKLADEKLYHIKRSRR
ncbi:MAG: GGDEF domain-containing protein [Erysipelotrichales bacterium]|nr:GGDEF domain-containing protein [Erysipelotrichales bacterium]